jgi:hypothetical protein
VREEREYKEEREGDIKERETREQVRKRKKKK